MDKKTIIKQANDQSRAFVSYQNTVLSVLGVSTFIALCFVRNSVLELIVSLVAIALTYYTIFSLHPEYSVPISRAEYTTEALDEMMAENYEQTNECTEKLDTILKIQLVVLAVSVVLSYLYLL